MDLPDSVADRVDVDSDGLAVGAHCAGPSWGQVEVEGGVGVGAGVGGMYGGMEGMEGMNFQDMMGFEDGGWMDIFGGM